MDILVFVESRGGKVRPAGLEALTIGRKIADKAGSKLSALVVGHNIGALKDDVSSYGADNILLADYEALTGYSPEGYREAITTAVEKTGAKLVILAATAMGRDLAPTVAGRMEAAFFPDCIGVEYNEGRLTVNRPVYAGRCILTLSAIAWPVVISVRPKAFAAVTRDGVTAEVANLDVNLDGKIRARLVETKVEAAGKLDVAEADVIVAGGRGLKEEGNFKLIEELADVLGGAVGASRAVVDNGWRPHSEQVGQTGKVVSPTLYFAIGISGAIQHLAGMRTSKVIVAVNKDAEAPVFKTADYGIVGDAMVVLPALTNAIKDN